MSGCARSTLIALSVIQTVAVVQAGERTALPDPLVAASGARNSGQREIPPSVSATLDRVAYAVDGAESSHGADLTMWRSDPSGPQGPMQVSEPAVDDVGGGDRFDSAQNRAIGRAYLAQLYRRYKNWPDAIAAYNWGMSNVDNWVNAGRPADKFVNGVATYLRRVLRDSGMCDGAAAAPVQSSRERTPSAHRRPQQVAIEKGVPPADPSLMAACADLGTWAGALDGTDRSLLGAKGHFYSKLERAVRLAMEHLPMSQRSADRRFAASWPIAEPRQ